MRNLYLVILIIFSTICNGQSVGTIIAQSGVIIREQPNRTSVALDKISCWGEFEILQDNCKQDTIDNFQGSWTKIKYKSITGYIFDKYYILNFSIRDTDIVILTEIPSYSGLTFPVNLNWYGLYSNKEGVSYLKKVEIKFDKFQSIPRGTVIFLKTNLSDSCSSKFIIGSRQPLKEKTIRNFADNLTHWQIPEYTNSLLPGYRNEIGQYKIINVLGEVTRFEGNNPIVNNYKILIDSCDLCTMLKFKPVKYIPNILFIGNIDDDDYYDFIIEEKPEINSSSYNTIFSSKLNIRCKIKL